jgi:hypothetical protein
MLMAALEMSEAYCEALKTVYDNAEYEAWNADIRCSAPP